jgi:hypothetical protein
MIAGLAFGGMAARSPLKAVSACRLYKGWN